MLPVEHCIPSVSYSDKLISVTMVTVACSNDGMVFTFGQNKYGQLGLGQTSSVTMPTELQKISDVCRVFSGRYHCAALTTLGALFMWGWGERGQLGQANNNNQYVPDVVKELKDHVISDIACGDGHTVALTSKWGVPVASCDPLIYFKAME